MIRARADKASNTEANVKAYSIKIPKGLRNILNDITREVREFTTTIDLHVCTFKVKNG